MSKTDVLTENRGFLPSTDPLLRVDRKECGNFNHFMDNLPYYYGSERMRQLTDSTNNLRFLNIGALSPEEKMALRRDLAFALVAYYHSLFDVKALELPEVPAQLLWQLAKEADTKPTLSYHLYALNNFWRPNPKEPISLENARVIRRFVSLIDEEWFIVVHVAFEARVEDIIKGIIRAHQSLSLQDSNMLADALTQIATTLRKMLNIMRQMPHACHPCIYYQRVRPQIMPFRYVIFKGVTDREARLPLSFVAGETGAQTPTLPILDAFLNIKHQPTDGYDFVKEMRCYMLPEHRGMLELVESMVSVREKITQSKSHGLKFNFNEVVRLVHEFRKLHYQYAVDYIFSKPTKETGTGGTPVKWLKQLMNETLEALID